MLKKNNKKISDKNKLKVLPPTLRENRRYIVYEAMPASAKQAAPGTDRKVVSFLNEKLGLFEAAEAGIIPVSFDHRSIRGVISVNRSYATKVKALLALYTGEDVILRSVGVSGMVNKAKERFAARKSQAEAEA